MITNTTLSDYYELSDDLFELLISRHNQHNPDILHELHEIAGENGITYDETVSSNPVIKEISAKLYEMCRQGVFLRNVFHIKFYYLFDAIIYAINHNNYLMLADNTRALFEHIGTLAYLSVETEKTAKNLKKTNSEKRFLIEFQNLVEHYNKLFYVNVALENQHTVLHSDNELTINNLFPKYIAKIIPDQKTKVLNDDFMFLSDCVHPNLGSYLLISSGYLKEESKIFITEEERRFMVRKLLASLHRLLDMSNTLELAFIQAGNSIENMYRISLNENENVASLFSPLVASKGKKKAIIGDGKSPQTAIFFPIARTITEEVALCHEYVDKNNLVRHSYKFEYIENGWKFYSFMKRNKKVWFKVQTSLT